MREIGHVHRVYSFENVFTIDNNRVISMIKVRVVQAMIQVAKKKKKKKKYKYHASLIYILLFDLKTRGL